MAVSSSAIQLAKGQRLKPAVAVPAARDNQLKSRKKQERKEKEKKRKHKGHYEEETAIAPSGEKQACKSFKGLECQVSNGKWQMSKMSKMSKMSNDVKWHLPKKKTSRILEAGVRQREREETCWITIGRGREALLSRAPS